MSIMDSGIFKLLDDIRISSERILAILESQTKESFLDADASWTAQDIIARRLSIIGEAAASLSRKYPDFCEKHPEIPFRMIIGMRNILIHDYGAIDWMLVWDTIQQDIPPLLTHVSSLITALEADGNHSFCHP